MSAAGPPPARIGWVCIDAVDPESLATWWRGLVGGRTEVDDDGDVRLLGGALPVLFLRVPEPKTPESPKNRLHLDLETDDYDAAVAAALANGAAPADDVHVTERWRVLRDPEGNEFCILRPAGGGAPSSSAAPTAAGAPPASTAPLRE